MFSKTDSPPGAQNKNSVDVNNIYIYIYNYVNYKYV